MGRIRSLKPEFGHNDKLSALPAEVHLFAALLLPHVDDAGYFPTHPKLLHAMVCPLRELSVSIPSILTELSRIGYVELHTGTDGREYGKVTNFLKHQYIQRATPSKIQPLCEPSVSPPVQLREPSVSPPVHICAPRARAGSGSGSGTGEVEMELGSGRGTRTEEQEPPTPNHLHPLNYARKLLEDIQFPLTRENMTVVAASIEAEVKSGKSGASAYEFILAGVNDAKDQGCEINRFFFADAKYRVENRNNGHGRKDTVAERNKRALDEFDKRKQLAKSTDEPGATVHKKSEPRRI